MKKKLLFIIILLLLNFTCSLMPDPDLKGEAIIVLTFDDLHESIFKNAYPIMQEFGYSGTNYVTTGCVDMDSCLSLNELHILESEGGWESGGHTINHAMLTQLSLAEAEKEIQGCFEFLKVNNLKHNSFALPSGFVNADVIEILEKYFKSIRGSTDIKIKPPIDPYYLGYFGVRSTDDPANVIGRILSGIANHECLLIIGFHRILNNKDIHPRVITPQEFSDVLEFIHDRNLRVMTISEAIETICSHN